MKHPGRGKKTCAACETVCGAAAKICPECKRTFEKVLVDKTSEVSAGKRITLIPEEYRNYRILCSIHTPAGYCPIKLKKDADEADVKDWADQLRTASLEKRSEWLTNNALCYYLRYDYPYDSQEYLRLKKIVVHLVDLEHSVDHSYKV